MIMLLMLLAPGGRLSGGNCWRGEDRDMLHVPVFIQITGEKIKISGRLADADTNIPAD